MKSFLSGVLFLAGGLLTLPSATAQTAVPNGSLETWQAHPGYDAPQGWQTSDDLLAAQGIPLSVRTVAKSAESGSGQFAARLQAKPLLATSLMPAMMVLGRITNPRASLTGGTPYTGRPTQLQLQYKFTGLPTDSAYVVVSLTRGALTAPNAEIVGQGAYYFTGGVNEFRPAAVPIRYASTNAPDTLRIFFVTGVSKAAPSPNAAFFVDDIAMSFAPLAVKASTTADSPIQVYPNPSTSGDFVLSAEHQPALAAGSFSVLDAHGRTVLEEPAVRRRYAQNRPIRLHDQPAGLYWLRLETAEGPLVQKLLIP